MQGGLGNQLFGWATGFSLASRIEANLTLDVSNLKYRPYELDIFSLADYLDITESRTNPLKHFVQKQTVFSESSFQYDSRILEVTNSIKLQ